MLIIIMRSSVRKWIVYSYPWRSDLEYSSLQKRVNLDQISVPGVDDALKRVAPPQKPPEKEPEPRCDACPVAR